ncbi:chemotaxis protein [Oribacterium sp. NK2B42]|uniref:chemotaxis protein n=1 Tax=Oribacterium sp. NK2B42 TaxID=689781 RepID=UPI000423A440|nr:chemotaxis protein [Oribacterium sp. NK2B42]
MRKKIKQVSTETFKIKKELMDEFSASCEKAGVDEGFQLKKLITDFNDKVASQG